MNRRPSQQPAELATMPDVTPSILGTMVSQSTVPVLVSFHASGAKAMAPALSDIAAEAAGRLQAVQVDVSVYPHIAERFKVRVIPTLLIFKHGVPVEFLWVWCPSIYPPTIRRAIGAVSKPVPSRRQGNAETLSKHVTAAESLFTVRPEIPVVGPSQSSLSGVSRCP